MPPDLPDLAGEMDMATKVPDEQVRAAARELLAEGQLTLRELARRAGGGQWERLSRIMTEVRVDANAPAPAAAVAQPDDEALPDDVREVLDRVESCVSSALATARKVERQRAWDSEHGLSTRHAAHIAELEGELAHVRHQLVDLETGAAEQSAELEALTADVREARATVASVESAMRQQADAHVVERGNLTGALAAAQESARLGQSELHTIRAEATRLVSALATAEAEISVLRERTSRLTEVELLLDDLRAQLSQKQQQADGADANVWNHAAHNPAWPVERHSGIVDRVALGGCAPWRRHPLLLATRGGRRRMHMRAG